MSWRDTSTELEELKLQHLFRCMSGDENAFLIPGYEQKMDAEREKFFQLSYWLGTGNQKSNLSGGAFAMLSKNGEVSDRCSVNAPQFAERSLILFPSSSLRRDDEVSRRPRGLGATRPDGAPNFDSTGSSCQPGAYEFPEILSQDDRAITISVIEGRSKGLTYQLNKLCITVGRIGGGADFEFDEPEASNVHCVIAARQDRVRLYVAPSANNIYVNDQRIYTVELAHMSTFRVGSSLLLITVFPSLCPDIR